LDIFTMVGLRAGKPESPLFQNGIVAVPERERQAQALFDIAETSQPVLSPAVGPRAGMVMGQVTPGVAVVAVVFSDRTPLALAQMSSAHRFSDFHEIGHDAGPSFRHGRGPSL